MFCTAVLLRVPTLTQSTHEHQTEHFTNWLQTKKLHLAATFLVPTGLGVKTKRLQKSVNRTGRLKTETPGVTESESNFASKIKITKKKFEEKSREIMQRQKL